MNQVKIAVAPLVEVKPVETFIVTIGDFSAELTRSQAYALFRALERVV